ncbi:MAG: hypothetical protein HKN06_07855 [Gammaproteobacteria bacterium]|nr:hypothetical protein [Gammaproteobacteria bacterium]
MLRFSRFVIVVFLSTSFFTTPAQAVTRDAVKRDYDARPALNAGLNVVPTAAQQVALDALEASITSLGYSIDHASGVTRTLSNHTGYLTGSQSGDHEAIALAFVNANATLLGLSAADLTDMELESKVYSAVSGATHIYWQQVAAGLSLYNGQLHVNVNRDGRIISVNNRFLPQLAGAVNTTTPALTAADAVAAAAAHLGTTAGAVSVQQAPSGTDQYTVLSAPAFSQEPIEARLTLVPIAAGNARLAWNFLVFTNDSQHIYQFNIDAVDGTTWTRFDAVDSATYEVYEQPVESPNHTAPLPPADGRTIQLDPADATASPFGWHDTDGFAGADFTITRGNNVEAYEDRDGNNNPPAAQVNCGPPLDCTAPINLTVDPVNHIPASVINLFYWNNIIHDVQYQYGFDEAAGNFQLNNYGRGGDFALDQDWVEAEAQDDANDNSTNGGNCNANFGTLPDGFTGRMQMYTCDLVTPERDGDLDNGVIVHEYGHGISNRLVGGPLNTFCLEGDQQPGEGLSDWWALVYTAEVGDTGPDVRGIGTYLFGQAPDGPGIRPFPYSTDNSVNPDTYESIGSRVAPHGVGSVWAQAAWEVYWALVDQHGFSPDLYDAMGGSGNQRAMLYVNEGLKNTICQPTFADVRDGIVQAAVDNYGGEDVCLIWQAFADFGLGADAVPGTPATTVVVNGFSPPRECQADFTLSVTPDELAVCAPASADYVVDLGVNPPAVPAAVTLSLSGAPAGATATFAPNPATAPAASALSIATPGATPGTFTMTVTGDDGGTFRASQDIGLALYNAPAGQPVPVAPVDGAERVGLAPLFRWDDGGQGGSYELTLASDAAYTSVIASTTTTEASHTFDLTLDPFATYYWRVRAMNSCGDSAFAESSFTTGAPGFVLLVDDDDNDPDVRAAYTAALANLAMPHDVWDTANSDNEPTAVQLSAYNAVVWFSGDEFGGFAGPGAAGESALGSYLDAGGCLLLSSQDYFYDRGNTAFMTTHLGLLTATSDVEQVTVGGAGSIFGTLGNYSLDYPFSNYSDDLVPEPATSEIAFTGNASVPGGGAAINKTDGIKSAYFGYPVEALGLVDRTQVMAAFLLDRCGLVAPDSDSDGILDIQDNCPFTANPGQEDQDLDGLGNVCDNCIEVDNPDQCDTNGDKFGNLCDADLDNNGIVNSFDLGIMREEFGKQGKNDADLDCDEVVNTFDLAIMRELFGTAPGPSGTD